MILTRRKALSALLSIAIAAPFGAGLAQGPSGTRFESVPPQNASADQVRGLGNGLVTVMVQVSGDPVTVVDANAGQSMSKSQKQQLKQQLAQKQAPIATQLQALGGTVLASYQSSYNGLRVSIPRGQLAQIRGIPDVVGVHQLTPKAPGNVHGIPLIGAPQVWGGAGGFTGEGIKIAIIDTGIDYTHADFGGPGTAAAFENAAAHSTEAADPSLFGPNAPRVKGGTDLVGDDYNADPNSASYQPVPHPDPNPLDCFGHGTHVAGTAAGSGVLSNGSTFTGPYDASTVSSHTWNVGPGAAPKADLYAIRVFGCAGSTDVVVDAIEWAVDNGMNVINMSLGSPYGSVDDPDAVASDNATKDGVIVVASAGNNGPNPYLVGSPSVADSAISIAASDPTASFPAANIALSTGTTLQAIDANGIPVAGLNNVPIVVLYTGTPHDVAHISLGCNPAEYTAAGVTGKLVVVKRGTCARVARAIFGQQAGAVAVLMINTTNSFPPFEGQITENPDTGVPFTVTIPFLGVPSSKAAALVAADGGTATLTDTTLPNPGYLSLASFTSGGPRSGDSALKPDVTAPGVSISSAGIGTGNGPAVLSGTSMAAPHTTGTAALVREAHPSWKKVEYWKAAIVNTADASLVAGYSTRLAGSGLIQAQRAVTTQAVALGDHKTATLNYGFVELGSDYGSTHQVTLQNFGASSMTFTVGHARDAGSPHSITTPASVTVPAGGSASVDVTLNVPVATAGDSSSFHDVAGQITFTPTGGANNGVALSVPYYLVPQAISQVHTTLNMTQLQKNNSATATVTNAGGATTGTADWYAWGISNPKKTGQAKDEEASIQAVGVQSFPGVLAFGVSTYNPWSNAAQNEVDIYVDVNGDGTPDYVVVEADFGALTAGTSDGRAATAVFDLRTGSGSIQFLADAPTNSSTMVLPVLISQLCRAGSPCLSAANPRISYFAVMFGRDGSYDETLTAGTFNAFTPSISTGMFDVVAPNGSATETVTLNPAEFAITPNLGVMVLSHDNKSSNEAQLIGFKQ